MKCRIHAKIFNARTGIQISKTRRSIFDSKKDELFTGCSTILEAKNAYEQFYNNDDFHKQNNEITFVTRVTLLD